MATEDDDNPKLKITHDIGQDLYLLSAEEIGERIALLSAEIGRLKMEAAKKSASRDAANSLFKS